MTMMWNNGGNNGGGGWVLMILLMIVFWTLVVGGVIWWLRNRHQHQEPTAPGESAARRILDERFARGELTEEEYRQRCDQLNAR
jgi:putative membrane protein